MDGPRIVIVGAGGWVFPLELCRDILAFPALTASTLVLYDIDPAAAERTEGFVRRLIEDARLPARVEVAPDLRSALRGADVVLTVFQVGGVEAYALDIEIPRAYGIDQTVGDTLGPGGVFRGLRTVEALREVAEAMLEICPDAWLLNYANPMSINCWAIERLGVRIVGLCHSVQGTSELLARELGVPYEEITFDCAGVNHTAWFTTFRRGEEDLIPRIREVMKARHVDRTLPLLPRSEDAYESIERVRTELMLLTGYFHTESSHHASEYWAWFRRTPELAAEYLDRRWDYLEICRSSDASTRNEDIVEEARREQLRMAEREEVVQRAIAEAERIRAEAEAEARRMKLEAEDYIDAKLAQFEAALARITEELLATNEQLTRTIDQVRAGREKLRAAAPATNPEIGPDVAFPEEEA